MSSENRREGWLGDLSEAVGCIRAERGPLWCYII